MCAASHNQTSYTIEGLQKKAEQFAWTVWHKQTSTWNMGPIIAVELNQGLKAGCPALRKYCAGFQKLGLTELKSNTLFAWHGTPDLQNIASICHDGFNPDTRRRQRHGTGEYFGVTAGDSHSFSGNTDRLIVVQILQCSSVSTHYDAGCHVVKNPITKNFTFVLPVLVITYGNGAPLSIPWISSNNAQIPYPFCGAQKPGGSSGSYTWHWTKDGGNLEPFDSTVNDLIERHYQRFQRDGPSRVTIGPITRYCDNMPQSYVIDFTNWTQKNVGTGYVRRIKRMTSGQNRWCWKDEGGVTKPYPSEISDAIESRYQDYVGDYGGSRIRLPSISRDSDNRTQSYIIDFKRMTQTNESTGFVRSIERREDGGSGLDDLSALFHKLMFP